MARNNLNHQVQPVYDAAQTWKERCLLKDGSMLSEGKNLWTQVLLDDPNIHGFTKNYEAHEGNFFEKLNQQTQEFPSNRIQLIAEFLWLIFLFPSRVTPQKKRDNISQVWSWTKEDLNMNQDVLSDQTLIGIGSAGANYDTRRWRELAVLISTIQRFKHLPRHEQEKTAKDPWIFAEWLYGVPETRKPQIGHVLTHLLFPDEFERLSARGQKVQVLHYFRNLSVEEFDRRNMVENDQELLDVRNELEKQKDRQIDFYDEDIHNLWKHRQEALPEVPDSKPTSETLGRDPVNLIVYGPPGTGKTRKLKEDYFPNYQDSDEEDRFEFITFHQSYAYEDFVEGIRPVTEDGAVKYEVRWGPLRRICDQARKAPDKRFALFIDEINRGNVAKIFGELITLVEADKRIRTDASGARLSDFTGLEVTLPYSGDKFGVPVNVDVIGTMNTADRSIALLDSALRRRFEFEELAPQPELLDPIPDGDGGQIDLRRLLEAMNARLTHLLHRDQTLGHSYLMGLESFEDLRLVFEKKILPFLQEVFYDDWRQIRLVLADDSVEQKELQLIRKRAVTVGELFPGADLSEIGDRPAFDAAPANEITPDAIRKIYELPE